MLRATGVSIGMTGISGLAVAEKHPDENRGTEQAGIQNAVDRLLQNGRVEQANKLLKKHDIEHATTKRTMKHSPEGPSTQDEWGKSESEWIRSTWVEDESDDRYGSYLWWHLKGGGCACDGAGPNDGVGLTLNPDNWNIDTGNRYSDEHTTLEDRDAEGRLGIQRSVERLRVQTGRLEGHRQDGCLPDGIRCSGDDLRYVRPHMEPIWHSRKCFIQSRSRSDRCLNWLQHPFLEEAHRPRCAP